MDSDEPPSPGYLFSASSLIFVAAFSLGTGVAIFLLLFLLFCSAVISGSEVAYFSLSPNDLEDLREEKSRSSERMLYLRSIPRELLATILISNNFINIAIVVVSNWIITDIVSPETFRSWGSSLQQWPLLDAFSVAVLATAANFLITVVAVTFLLVLFGEVSPKIYAKLHNIQLARFMSTPLVVLTRLFSPFSKLLVRWSQRIERRLSGTGSSASKDDIDKAIDLAVNKDSGSKKEAAILKGIIKFNDVPVKQIMRSRVDVVAVDIDTGYKDLRKVIKSSGYSRIPVFDEEFDKMVGILYVKDLIGHRNEGNAFRWQKLVRNNILYIPESKKLNELLREFQQERLHIGIVVDEYGGTSGIVTLEDIMEEVLGEIKEEFDSEKEMPYNQLDPNTYIFDGKMLLNDICRLADLDSGSFDDLRGDADSIAGLILEQYGEIPERNMELVIEKFKFKVMAVSKRRIIKVRFQIQR